MTRATLFGLIGLLTLAFASPLVAQPFTYQGFLRQGGQPVNGTTSLTFRLYDAPTGGNQLGSAITQTVSVQNGLFTVVLDFGTVWTGANRYLEIQVGSTTLSPRVKITPAPYASFAQRPWQTSGSNIFYNDGNVGIGTSSPQARLHVKGGNAYFTNNTTLQILPGTLFGQSQANAATLEIPGNGVIGVWDTLRTTGDLNVGGGYFSLGGGTDPTYRRVEALVVPAGGGLYSGVVGTLGANGNSKTRLTWMTGYPNHGAVSVHDSFGNVKAMMFVHDDGMGWITANAKFFCVPDPDDPTRDIWYGCIEGPELAMYVRGTARLVNGRARIELPDHFRKLADEQGMTVQLTPRSAESKGLAAVRVSLDGIEVVELLNGRGNYEFDWEVKAVRKEHRDFRVYRPWDEEMSVGIDPAEAWEARLQSIQARQARQQAGANKGVQ